MKLKKTYVILMSFLFALVSMLSVPSADVAQQASYTLLVAGDRDVQVVRITPTGGNIVRTIPTLGDTVALGVAPNGQYAISLNEGYTVSVITGLDRPNPSETGLLIVGVSPTAIAFTEDNRSAIVINSGDDPASYSVIRGLPDAPTVVTIPICVDQPCFVFQCPFCEIGGTDIALLPGNSGTALTDVVTSSSDDFFLKNGILLDGVTSTEPARVRIIRGQPQVSGSSPVAVTPDGSTGFIYHDGSILRVIRLQPDQSPQIAGVTNTGDRGARMENGGIVFASGSIRITPDGSMLLATKVDSDFQASVLFYRITLAGLSLFMEVPLDASIFSTAGTRAVAVSPGGKVAVVSSSNGTLFILRGIDTGRPFLDRRVGPLNELATTLLPQAIAFVPSSQSITGQQSSNGLYGGRIRALAVNPSGTTSLGLMGAVLLEVQAAAF